jgi:hypothetical protein
MHMTPFDFGFQIGTLEKQAINWGGLGARLQNVGSSIARGAQTVNQGSKHIVKGFGRGMTGAGQLVGGAAQNTAAGMGSSQGLGGLALSAGREAMKGGERMIRGSGGTSGVSRDLMALLGHGVRLGGRTARGAGHVTNFAGDALQFGGRQLENLAGAHYGVPTLAAAGLLGGTAAVAPKLPLPGVKLKSPIDINFGYKTQNPVEFEW